MPKKRGEIEFEATDSASGIVLFLHHILIRDKLIQPFAKYQETGPDMKQEPAWRTFGEALNKSILDFSSPGNGQCGLELSHKLQCLPRWISPVRPCTAGIADQIGDSLGISLPVIRC